MLNSVNFLLLTRTITILSHPFWIASSDNFRFRQSVSRGSQHGRISRWDLVCITQTENVWASDWSRAAQTSGSGPMAALDWTCSSVLVWQTSHYVLRPGSYSWLMLISYCHTRSLLANQSVARAHSITRQGKGRESQNFLLLDLNIFIMKLPSITQACHIGHQLGRKVAINCLSVLTDSLWLLKINANLPGFKMTPCANSRDRRHLAIALPLLSICCIFYGSYPLCVSRGEVCWV